MNRRRGGTFVVIVICELKFEPLSDFTKAKSEGMLVNLETARRGKTDKSATLRYRSWISRAGNLEA